MMRPIGAFLALLALVVLSPVLAIVAILVRLGSPGPVIFRQSRVGRGGQPFDILKFRTMAVTAPGRGPLVTASDDPRVTRIGRHLRSTKLDELPQLINVLRGDMAFVGPRPEVPRYVERWEPSAREIILSVRPGITDPASIAFRREADLLAAQDDPESYYCDVILPAKARLYVDYVLRKTFWGDMRTIVATVRSVVAG